MRAGQNFFLEKVPFLENKKVYIFLFYLRFDFFRVYCNKDITEYIFPTKKIIIFCPLDFFENIYLLVVPHIVPRSTATCLCKKFEKSAKLTHPSVHVVNDYANTVF